MRMISWNINGLRAHYKKGAWDFFLKEQPDFFCLQEIKCEAQELPDEVRTPSGYFSYFNSSKGRKGYSGVAIYSKYEPSKVVYGFDIPHLDQEGRMIELHFDHMYGGLVLINLYFPNGGGGAERLAYKLAFYDAFLAHIDTLRKLGKKIVFCGDVNTAHTEIDLARPKENEKNTGFLPEERAWIDEVVDHGYVDTFRHLHSRKIDAYTYWDQKTRARERNVGWRIDYFFVSSDLVSKVSSAVIHGEILGSDHCPIEIEMK